MAGSPINSTKHMQRQGLDPKTIYSGVVVDNMDPRKARRVRVRVTGIFPASIPDEHLPWALPMDQSYANIEGATGAGFVNIPPKGAKVGLMFPKGDPHKPVLAPYPGDQKTIMKLAETNYPNRMVMLLENGCSIVVDKTTNDVIVANPGDTHFAFLGDYSKTIVGSCTEIVTGSKGDVPGFVSNASNSKINEITAKSSGGVSKGKGNKFEKITGNYTLEIGGNRTVKVGGNDTLNVSRNRDEKVGGNHKITAARSDTN